MNVSKINSTSYSPEFKGMNSPHRIANSINIYKIASRLSMSEHEVAHITKGRSGERFHFLYNLARRFNNQTFYQTDGGRSANTVIDLFKSIKHPNKKHFYLLDEYKGSFENLRRTLDGVKNNKSRLDFISKVNREILNNNNDSCENILPELLESEHAKKYIKNYSNIKSYLKLNSNNPDAVKNLDKMFTEGTYNHKEYDKILRDNKIKAEYPISFETDIFNKDVYLEKYNKEGASLLKTLRSAALSVDMKMIDADSDKEILKLYLTTNKDNLSIRKNVLKYFFNSDHIAKKDNLLSKNLADFNEIFARMDNDKHVKSFIQKVIKENNSIHSIKNLKSLLDLIPSVKLDIFSDNIFNIVKKSNANERVEKILEHIENPFYKTDFRHQSGFTTFCKSIKNKINQIRLKCHKIAQPESFQVNEFDSSKIAKDNIETSIGIKPEIKKEAKEPVQNVTEKLPVKEVKPEIEVKSEKEVNTLNDKKPQEKIEQAAATQPKPLSARQIQKQKTINDVLNMAKPKVGPKTMKIQHRAFERNATKMRLSMLPEIFSSIADTRKAERAAGLKRMSCSNQDALELFVLIEGSNKKFINYLLKKRNPDNTRTFNINDILKIVREARAKIWQEKRTNPNYRANDARKYYNKLYEETIQTHGKLKPQRKINKKA